jgi:outer membrane protein OmpA-like peptidoglycan-associated protein
MEGIMAGPHRTRQARAERTTSAPRPLARSRSRASPPVSGLPRVLREAGNAAISRELGRQTTGRPLDPAVQARMERALGTDLGHVRVHDDAGATEAADAVRATAFAHGPDVFVGPDAPPLGSPQGKEMLAHELTHVVQHERSGGAPNDAVSDPADAFEAEATRAQRSAMSGQPVMLTTSGAPPAIQRQKQDEGFVEKQLEKLLDKALEEGIQYDSKDGWKVGGVPVKEVPRGAELVERLLKGDVQGAIELFKPRDPKERERYREETRRLQRELDRLRPREERKREDEQMMRDLARKEAERLGLGRREEPRLQLPEPSFNLKELGIRPGMTTPWVIDRFRLERASIEPQHKERLNDLAAQAKSKPDAEIEIVGHADTTGPLRFNQGLSERRANAVRDYLIARGVEPGKIKSVTGRGAEAPLVEERTEDDRARNRRVEILLRTGPTQREPLLKPPSLP